MAILFKCVFVCDNEKLANICHIQMLSGLKRLSSEGMKVTPESLVESVSETGCWESRMKIWREDGTADPEFESAEAHDISDGIGAPWETAEDGRVRYMVAGTGGFSSDFNLSKLIELRLA